MTIYELMKQIPEEKRNYIIIIDVPHIQYGDETDAPLINLFIDDINRRIYLEGDFNKK
jgi:hypothetical protein